MKLDLLLTKIEEVVKPYYVKKNGLAYDDIHDWSHVKRVYGACVKMLEIELKANRGEVLIAALLHDVGRSTKGDVKVHAESSYEIGKCILKSYQNDFEANNMDLEKVLLMVKYHSIAHICPDKEIADSLEFNIFTDADKIDMFGPLGILRISVGIAYLNSEDSSVDQSVNMLELMSKDDKFTFQSKAGKIVGQKYKDYLKKYISDIKSERQELEY
jgi:5'-deoxynucleotidase YfbR-like HD superfamily hydrolase